MLVPVQGITVLYISRNWNTPENEKLEKFAPEWPLPNMANSSINVGNQVYSAICMLSDVRKWLDSDMGRPEIDFRFTPESRRNRG
jgi:hypothetical protein